MNPLSYLLTLLLAALPALCLPNLKPVPAPQSLPGFTWPNATSSAHLACSTSTSIIWVTEHISAFKPGTCSTSTITAVVTEHAGWPGNGSVSTSPSIPPSLTYWWSGEGAGRDEPLTTVKPASTSANSFATKSTPPPLPMCSFDVSGHYLCPGDPPGGIPWTPLPVPTHTSTPPSTPSSLPEFHLNLVNGEFASPSGRTGDGNAAGEVVRKAAEPQFPHCSYDDASGTYLCPPKRIDTGVNKDNEDNAADKRGARICIGDACTTYETDGQDVSIDPNDFFNSVLDNLDVSNHIEFSFDSHSHSHEIALDKRALPAPLNKRAMSCQTGEHNRIFCYVDCIIDGRPWRCSRDPDQPRRGIFRMWMCGRLRLCSRERLRY